MKQDNRVLAMVMAGGKGERLYPLTIERSKPSVPFGGKYRLIDFPLSNLVNSGIYSIYILVQYKSQSLIEHVRTTWQKAGVLPQHFITAVPPQMRREEVQNWYRGTADAVYQNINLIYDFKPKIVAILSSDHIYRMNVSSMIDYHLKQKAAVTISAMPVKSTQAFRFGILNVDSRKRVTSFREKPHLSGEKLVWASMGNYIFDAEVLIETLEEVTKKTLTHDFGKDIIPYLVKKKAKVFAYDFSTNRIPSVKKYEERCYWRDVGTIESYWESNMDLLGKRPKLNLYNKDWSISSSEFNAPPSFIEGSMIENSLVSEGTRIYDSKIKNSIIGRAVIIEDDCEIEDSIVMDHSAIGKNSRIKKTIIDRFNTVEPESEIGYNRKADLKKYFISTASGITVLRRGARQLQK